METFVIENGWDSILKAKDPREMYKAIVGEELSANYQLPAPADLAAFRAFMDEIASELKPPARSRSRTIGGAARPGKNSKSDAPKFDSQFEKVNGNREEVKSAREAALRALNSAPQKIAFLHYNLWRSDVAVKHALNSGRISNFVENLVCLGHCLAPDGRMEQAFEAS